MHRPGELQRMNSREGLRAVHLERMETLGMIQREFWIECDACQKWRRTTAQVAEDNTTRRWVCRDGARSCGEPCDYCFGVQCRCDLMGDDESTWCVSQGYNIPNGFAIQLKPRKERIGEGGALGHGSVEAYVVYTAFCDKCSVESGLLDRRSKVEVWLNEHAGCRPEWGRLTPGDFDFRVHSDLRKKLQVAQGNNNAALHIGMEPRGDTIPARRATVGQEPQPNGRMARADERQSGLPSRAMGYSRPWGGFDSIANGTGPSLFRPNGGVQLWGPAASTAQSRQPAVGGFPQSVQYRPVWTGTPYGQAYGWMPISDNPQFRNM